MTQKKIINDPVYGFIRIPEGLIYTLISHPYFQRLRRIQQLGMTQYVYPGATHTRFLHALGAFHLMTQAIKTLRDKAVTITPEEEEAVLVAILLHDIGHGPFSHALEHTLVQVPHETISRLFMEELNDQLDNRLTLAIKIFQNQYHKKFLYQLVSSQLDMDRMDYLNRDSYFTGVSEGIIGYHRLISMLNVDQNELVIEEKGIYSIEKFLVARRLMYWQVYLHKTVLSAEQMLIKTLKRAQYLTRQGKNITSSKTLLYFLAEKVTQRAFNENSNLWLHRYAQLDDYDIESALKIFQHSEDTVIQLLSTSLINRQLFKLELTTNEVNSDKANKIKIQMQERYPHLSEEDLAYLVFSGRESNQIYKSGEEPIKVVFKNGRIRTIDQVLDIKMDFSEVEKYYICYPRL